MTPRFLHHFGVRCVALLVLLGVAACDGAVGPDVPPSLPLAFTIAASESAGATENDALGRAFDMVDKYRVIVRDGDFPDVFQST